MTRALLLLALLCVGCPAGKSICYDHECRPPAGAPLTYDNAGAALLEAWDEAGLLQPTEECAQRMLNAQWSFTDNTPCGNPKALACARFAGWDNHPVIEMRPGAEPSSLVHEYAHVLSECTYGTSDHDHERAAVWAVVKQLGE